jgi:Zn-dependent M28 family amino/carboxypeptidase
MTRSRIWLYLGAIVALFLLTTAWYGSAFYQAARLPQPTFDGQRAWSDVRTQVSFGPRIPQSEAHAREVAWIQTQLAAAGWSPDVQSVTYAGHPIENVVGSRGSKEPEIILGAHYDSRLQADRDSSPARRNEPVPGANDGASGVAVLLELARSLPDDTVPISLVFFDAEDNGNIPGWDWILGSRAYVANMRATPKAMILVDMVGGANLRIPMEGNSDGTLRASIWQTASQLGYGDIFLQHVKYNIEDDHTPFIQAGIPSVDIIDLDYAYWHTTEDTPEHVSARSLEVVGSVLQAWIERQPPAEK